MKLSKLLNKYRTIAVASSPNQGKTSLILEKLIETKKEMNMKKIEYEKLLSKCQDKDLEELKKILKYYDEFKIYCYGVEESLHPILRKNGIKILYNAEDILDLQIKNSLIFIDEMNNLFDGKVANKQTKKFFNFINRIYHLNNYLIGTTARSGYWNKTMEDAFRCFIIKSIEYDSLIQRTKLKKRVEGIQSNSLYRLDIPIDTYYVIEQNKTEKYTFNYNPKLDSKKDNHKVFDEISIFGLSEKLSEKLSENKSKKIFR